MEGVGQYSREQEFPKIVKGAGQVIDSLKDAGDRKPPRDFIAGPVYTYIVSRLPLGVCTQVNRAGSAIFYRTVVPKSAGQ